MTSSSDHGANACVFPSPAPLSHPQRCRGVSDDGLNVRRESRADPQLRASRSVGTSHSSDSIPATPVLPILNAVPEELSVKTHSSAQTTLPFRLTIGFCGSRRCSVCTLSPNRLAMLFHIAVLLAAFVGALVGIHFKEVFLPSINRLSASISRNWADISEAAGRLTHTEDGLLDECHTLWEKITSVLSIWPVVALMIFVLLTRVRLESDPNKKESGEGLSEIVSMIPQMVQVRYRSLTEPGDEDDSFRHPSAHTMTAQQYPNAEIVGERIANRFSASTLDAVEGSDIESSGSNPALDGETYDAYNDVLFPPLPTTSPMSSHATLPTAGVAYPNPYQSVPLAIPASYLTPR